MGNKNKKNVKIIMWVAIVLLIGIVVALLVSNSFNKTGNAFDIRSASKKQILPAPIVTPSAGIYTTPQSVVLSTTPGVSIYYTLNGNNPTTLSAQYSSPIPISVTTTLKAMTKNSNGESSGVLTAVYTMKVQTPVANVPSGSYASTQYVSLTTGTPGASIYYTKDGSIPTTSSPQYTSAISVSANTTIKAIAAKTGMANSGILSLTYTMKVPTPTAFPAAGTYNTAPIQIGLGITTPGTQIYYTTNGVNPTATSTLFNGTFSISGPTTTVKAIAMRSGLENSSVLTAVYNFKVATPVANPSSPVCIGTCLVSLTSTTSNTDIHYTMDGNTPTAASALYNSPIIVSTNKTIKAIAISQYMLPSEILTINYTVKVATPTASPVAGTYFGSKQVSLTTITSGAQIYYTVDGSAPNTSSPTYNSPINISSSVTIKAMAIKSGITNSDVLTVSYTIQ